MSHILSVNINKYSLNLAIGMLILLVGWSNVNAQSSTPSPTISAGSGVTLTPTPTVIDDPDGFSDLDESNYFYKYIAKLVEEDVVSGFSDKTFRPKGLVTRAEMAKFIYGGLKVKENTTCTDFTDVSEEYGFYKEIISLKCEGIISGYPDGSFRPNEHVTRGSIMKFVVNGVRIKNEDKFAMIRDIQLFADVNLQHNFYNFIDSAASITLPSGERIINGYSTGNFGPEENTTREQMSKIISQTMIYNFEGGRYDPFVSTVINSSSERVVDGSIVNNDVVPNVIAVYEINHSENPPQIANSNMVDMRTFEDHQSIWDSYIDLVPTEMESQISKLYIVKGYGSIIAAVARDLNDDPNKFILIVDMDDIFFDTSSKIYSYVTLHESAHALTLGSDDIDINYDIYNAPSNEEFLQRVESEKNDCATFFVLHGCAKTSSYMYKFYDRFWGDKYSELEAIRALENSTAQSDASKIFYLKYNNQFVSSYSMFEPHEDLAESFVYFVMLEKPEDSISTINQKLHFFWEDTELVRMRNEIRTELLDRNY